METKKQSKDHTAAAGVQREKQQMWIISIF